MKEKGLFFPLVLGSVLVGIGIAVLVSSFVPGFSGFSLWPLLLLVFVARMLSGVQSKKDLAKVIFWCTYLTYLTVFFLVLNFLGWDFMKNFWPHFILAAGTGFLAEFLLTFDMHKLWEMIAALIIGVYFLIPIFSITVIGGIFLILWGIWILLQTLIPSLNKKKN